MIKKTQEIHYHSIIKTIVELEISHDPNICFYIPALKNTAKVILIGLTCPTINYI